MIPDATLIASVIIVIAAGMIRGITGFGGSMVMTPVLSAMFDPKLVIPVVLLLEAFVAAPALGDAVRKARFKVIVPICLAAFVTVPLGGYLLANTEPQVLRRWIAASVILFALMLLKDVRYTGPKRLGTSVALGALSGVLLGGTGIGGPPVILYLLSGADSLEQTRANLMLCITAISVAALAMLWSRGMLHFRGPLNVLILGPAFYAGIVLGTRFFRQFSEKRFRQFTLVLLIMVSIATLFL
jgi:uncharacterized membrane protein YfcA